MNGIKQQRCDKHPNRNAYKKTANAKFRAVSMTGEDGLVNMSTYGFAGAPAVKYKLIVTKTMDDDFVYSAEVNPESGEKDIVSFHTTGWLNDCGNDTA